MQASTGGRCCVRAPAQPAQSRGEVRKGGVPPSEEKPGRPGCNDAVSHMLSLDGEEAGHGRAATGLTLHMDRALMLFDGPMAEGEPEAQPLRLRREEWVEDLLAGRIGNP